MSDQVEPQLMATDLPMTLYLNQRLTFDLLATLEGGFSNFATVQTTSSGETATELSGGAQLGISNPFAFLGVQLGGHGSRQSGHKISESTTENIVHTPVSLFARLRRELRDRKLVRCIAPLGKLDSVRPGDFVEFEATLRRSPLIDVLDSFSELIPLMKLADVGTTQIASQSGRRRGGKSSAGQRKQDEISVIGNQIDVLRSAVTAEGSQDLVAEMGSMRVVLTVDQDYFIDPSMNDTIDGTFRVFGKATRIIPDNKEGISLLRRTALGKLGSFEEALAPMMASMQDSGFSGPVETEIFGPTMQVIPIAIFS